MNDKKDHIPAEGQRLQKVLAQAGIASRRHAEQMILEGRVAVNGRRIVELGSKVLPADKIQVDGREIRSTRESFAYYLLHKPTGYITSAKDPQGRRTVLELLPKVGQRVYPVGRLDYDTSGLLVLTNDGELAHRLMHPSFGVEKTYLVEVQGSVPAQVLKRLEEGIDLEDGKTAPAQVRVLNRTGQGLKKLLEITIHEGRNRQVRRMFEAIGFPVVSLKRIRFGPLKLDIEPAAGKFRALTAQEVKALRQAVKLK